jgi:hypothetical protein
MNLRKTIKRILREEINTSTYIRRRYGCMDELIRKLEKGEEIIPFSWRLRLNWDDFQIAITAFIRQNCDDSDGYYDPIKHSNIMELFGDRLYELYKEKYHMNLPEQTNGRVV